MSRNTSKSKIDTRRVYVAISGPEDQSSELEVLTFGGATSIELSKDLLIVEERLPNGKLLTVQYQAEIVIPEQLVTQIPEELYVPIDEEYPGDLPDIHSYYGHGVYSWRNTDSAHHRILIEPHSRRVHYVRRKVRIPVVRRKYQPFVTTWTTTPQGVYILHHNRPERKVDRWMNKPMRDWKDSRRKDPDHSRANALRHLSYRSPNMQYLQGAVRTNDPGIVADTALALRSL